MTSRIMVTDDSTGEEFDPQTTDHYEVNLEYTPRYSTNQRYDTKHYCDRKVMNRYLRSMFEDAEPQYTCTATIRRKLAPKPADPFIPTGYGLYLNSMYGRRKPGITLLWP